ncbi:helix-turn-helix domain-containing protein [Bradyrhizobium australafricanum]|uniref:helix-turn-helix domain-containing protein n=1 Tax=Bradyrhizobium australafricanum TaxID=2821406 RepID=UPI0028A039BB|nr:helix-turn-helix domain-containing protein [Bradyrhizobium australafricanum]
MFTPEIVDRGWPQAGLHFSIHEISQPAQDRLREVVRHILLVTSQPTDDAPFASGESIKETLLAAIDNAFAEIVPAKWTTRANTTRQFKVFNDARAILAGDVAHPIYSGELARQIGVSVRTLHDAIQRYRGVSLHRYLRLRRLWLVRQQLLAGAPSVKTCALAYGFWHLSDFSRSYRSQFGEAPSETLAASRRPGATRADPSRRHGS